MIFAFPLATSESPNKSLPFNSKLESILAPLVTVKESWKSNPPLIDNLPLTIKLLSTIAVPLTNKESFILVLPFTVNESFNLVTPITVNESFNLVLWLTNKLLLIFAFPLATRESPNKSLPFNSKLESILAPRITVKESWKSKPPLIDNLPLIVKFESTKTFPLTLKESFNVKTESILTVPFTYKLESIFAFKVFTFKLILSDNETVSLPILLVNIIDVSPIFRYPEFGSPGLPTSLVFNKLILFDKEVVSLWIRLLNIADVSLIFNLKPVVVSILAFNWFFKNPICVAILFWTYFMLATVLSLLKLSAVGVLGMPKKMGERINLFDKVSKPSALIRVPFCGKLREVNPVVLNFKFPKPWISKLLPRVIVFPALLMPVPPLSPASTPPNFVAESAITALKALNA